MNFLEKDLEEIIFKADRDKLFEKGICDYGKFYRQLKIGNYGIADIVSIQRPYYHSGYKKKIKGLITIYELKKDKISVSSFFQALGYLKGIKSYLCKKNKEFLFNYNIVLIGKEIDLNSTVCYLPSMFNLELSDIPIGLDYESITNVDIFKYKYDFDGINFESCENYDLKNKGF